MKERRALLEQLLQQEEMAETSLLSFAQEGLWFLNRLEPDSPADNISLLLRLRGELNIEGLSWSLNQIIERHEALRTHFAIRDEKACQIVSPPAPLELQVEDM